MAGWYMHRHSHLYWGIAGLAVGAVVAGLVTRHQTNPSVIHPQANAHCHASGLLPDMNCTPGDILTTDATVVCKAGYAASVRNVPTSLKQQTEIEYGYKANPGEVDHLISLELGGSNTIQNLWPEPSPDYKTKDRIENLLHARVCSGQTTLVQAQADIARDWTSIK